MSKMCVTSSEHQIGGNRMGVPEVAPKSDKSTKSSQKRSRRSRSSRQYWFGSGSSNLTNHYYQRGIVLLLLSTLQIIVQGRTPPNNRLQLYTKEHIFSQGELYLLSLLYFYQPSSGWVLCWCRSFQVTIDFLVIIISLFCHFRLFLLNLRFL